MNIRQAKEYIKDSVNLYLKKNEFGEYRIPVVRQRPIFLLGAPGIGKTAIMEQIAQELGVALVSYSMTHHTRQSALGLPFITQKVYGGREYQVSEYTMSEIIATIYDTMEESGIREGILFLDEINCVSETLAPSLLQFLQYKIFGRHQVPEGWVVVTAGNPPEYNKSVREFDVVTMDRLKLLEVEPDFGIWKEYAMERRVHPAIVNFLDLKKEYFYCMEMTAKGRSYVTARGWEDLSEMLALYEEEQMAVEESLVGQYIRNDRIVKEFTAYYDLYNKYKKDYRINEILEGHAPAQAIARAKEAAFDERLALLGMLSDRVLADMREVMEQAAFLKDLTAPLKAVKAGAETARTEQIVEQLEQMAEGRRKRMESQRVANSLSDAEAKRHLRVIRFLEERKRELYTGEQTSGAEAFERIRNRYDGTVAQMRQETERVQAELAALFAFVEEAFAQGNEMLILMTELTVDNAAARFIASFGSPDYQRHNREMLLSERSDDIMAQIDELGL
ncbi:MAG: AAA family ATPase [Clostridium sp.]|nr:AAA family ATPase [Acetatifactor muris]MCM1526358.1 AAA family ATPase [Bacteroides sp.]MCM1563990.1 AAA family ATPase [Clostridium sp.]